MVRLDGLLWLCICGRIRGFFAGWVLDRTTRELDSFTGNFTGSRFYLLRSGMLCAVRTLRLLRAVIQFFYKFLYYLALNGGCSSMFRLLIFRAVVSFSNI